MLENAKKIIAQYAKNKKVAVATSGGEDSMALLSLFCELKEEYAVTVLAVNVDHCIRKNSSHDSDFVRDFCRQNGVECISFKTDIPAACKKSGRGVECEAHYARKELFLSVINSGKADFVATAHHERDNAETVLLHLFRGSGIRGIAGIKLFDGKLLRPFLTTSKEDISAYVKANGIPFVTDETNADFSYDRNYIRGVVAPLIKERFPSFESAISRTAFNATEAAKRLYKFDESDFKRGNGYVSVCEQSLTPEHVFEALSMLGKDTDVYFAAVDRAMGLLNGENGKRVDLGDGYTAVKEYGNITFCAPVKDKILSGSVDFTLPSGSVELNINGKIVTVKKESADCKTDKRGAVKLFDASKLPKGCVWRNRLDGDRFTPFGGGTKKLKEYFIDKKIPARLRSDIPLLCCKNEVYIIAGIEISDKIAITDNLNDIYSVELKQ